MDGKIIWGKGVIGGGDVEEWIFGGGGRWMDFVRNSGEMDHISTVRIILRIEDGWIVLMVSSLFIPHFASIHHRHSSHIKFRFTLLHFV